MTYPFSMLFGSVQEHSHSFVIWLVSKFRVEILREHRFFTQEHHGKTVRFIRVAPELELNIYLILVVAFNSLNDVKKMISDGSQKK